LDRRRLAARTVPLGTLWAAAALLLCGSPLPAYLVRRTAGGANAGSEIRWNLSTAAANVVGGKVTFYLDTSDVPDVTVEQYRAAIREAIQSWEDAPHATIAFLEDDARKASGPSVADKVNRFGFTPGELGEFTLGAAYTAISGSRITDVDVIYNPDFEWSVQTPGDPGAADLEGVTVHEWGHGIGLDHIPLVHSTMYYAAYPGQLSLRSPEIDDRAAIGHAYPEPSLATDTATIKGRVTGSGGGDDRGIHVIALDVITNLPAASHYTGPGGDYAIEGLPPGVYRMIAAPIGTERVDPPPPYSSSYSPYWGSAGTDFLPAVRGIGGTVDRTTGAVVVTAGQVLEDVDFDVVEALDPLEPNDTIGAATPSALGNSESGRISGFSDHDVYSFAGTAGRKVTVLLHAGQIGSDLDPRIYLRNAGGTALATNSDIRNTPYAPEGPDYDCRILEFTLPLTATYYVEIEGEQSPDADRPEDFHYVLTMLESGVGVASPATSELTAVPAVVPADGTSSSEVVFRPRTLQATNLGPGQAVTFTLLADGNPDGVPATAVDEGDGTYSILVVAPAAAGSDVVEARVDGAVVSTVNIAWRGPAHAAGTTFSAAPERIRYDGASTSTLTVVPADVNGVPLGPGHTVAFSAPGADSASVGGTTDEGDGSYTATLTAGVDEEFVFVAYTVDGGSNLGPGVAGVGFPLEDVVDGLPDDLDGILSADPPPAAKAIPKLAKARDLLLAADPLTEEADAPAILAAIQKALKQLETAAKKGTGATDAAREAVEAAREAAMKALDAATLLADTDPELAAVAKAEGLLDLGEDLLDAGLRSKAAAKFKAALAKARKVE
jgi:hypothetical protein